ncbi:ATP-binding cassette domain-containing protein [Metamycoplasma salivarium]|uniref:ATP-binding cassette domain-containing protein n=1 Tax=Metamycoplasma salivarium TaxID=2124 RepID=UPI0035BBA2EE
MKENNIIFELKNIYKAIRKQQIIIDASFKIYEGSLHAFVGENGAGKSTIMNICVGNDLDYSGTLYFNNQNIDDIKNRKSFLFFNTDLKFPQYLNALEYVKNFVYAFNGNEISNDAIIEKFKEYEIEHRLKNNPNSFSSGEKKKLALLFSELANPKLLFLDEPEANLDPTSRLKLYQKLYEFKSKGMAVFVSTHLINEIKGYVDMATFITHGRIAWSGKIENHEQLASLYSKYILGNKEVK